MEHGRQWISRRRRSVGGQAIGDKGIYTAKGSICVRESDSAVHARTSQRKRKTTAMDDYARTSWDRLCRSTMQMQGLVDMGGENPSRCCIQRSLGGPGRPNHLR